MWTIKDNKAPVNRQETCPQTERPARKIYEKPVLRQLSLFADEVMGNCNLPAPTAPCSVFPFS